MITRKESPFEKYELLEQVGMGSFGSVFKAREKIKNETVAVKVMKKKYSYSECNHLKEYKTMKRMTFHPNIVQLYETFIAPTKECYFIMEYMNGGNLYQFIQERKETHQVIPLDEIKTILSHMLSGLSHIHNVEGIFHRDIKPENVLMSYDPHLVIKLADFGLAADIKTRTLTDYVSTRWYRAPEVLLKASSYSSPIDLWAVGTIFAELITLKPLFPGQSEIDQLFRICQILGSPTVTNKKSYAILQPPNFIASKRVYQEKEHVGIGGEWKEGIKLAHKMGFQFPKISKIDSLSTVLHPHPISNEGIDLLSKLLQFDPSKRMTSTNALSHPFFMPIQITINTTKTLFDLPIIPLSPFQLEEGEYTIPPVHTITRTTSYPNISFKENEHTMRRSISDVSIPPLPASPQQMKKKINRLKSLWPSKKHITV